MVWMEKDLTPSRVISTSQILPIIKEAFSRVLSERKVVCRTATPFAAAAKADLEALAAKIEVRHVVKKSGEAERRWLTIECVV